VELYEGIVGQDGWLPVRITDATDHLPVTGLAYDAISVQYAAAGATTWSDYTVAAADWHELGAGCYWLSLGADEWTAAQSYLVRITSTGNDEVRLMVRAEVYGETVTRRSVWLLLQRWLGDTEFSRTNNQLAVKDPDSGSTVRVLQYNEGTGLITQEDITP
jgi:hypothetical protein